MFSHSIIVEKHIKRSIFTVQFIKQFWYYFLYCLLLIFPFIYKAKYKKNVCLYQISAVFYDIQ
jgi:hypothetical protein